MDKETKAIYRNDFYKDLSRWLRTRREMDREQISVGEFLELAQAAVDEFKANAT